MVGDLDLEKFVADVYKLQLRVRQAFPLVTPQLM